MKKTLCILSICAVIAACGGGTNSESENTDNTAATDQPAETMSETPETTEASSDQPVTVGSDKGKELIAQSDCLTCHKEHDKLVGPSYADVAKKYEATEGNVDHLATKIIEGGKGVWGEIPMTPHASLSRDDAKEMVKYILSIK